MAWNPLSNGLLGMGGFGVGGQDMPTNSLLGQYYDPAEMRKYQMKQMLLGLGAGLMAEKGFGKGAALALAAGDRAGTVYRDNALDAYKIKTAADDRAYERSQDKMKWDYQVGRDKRTDALAAKDAAWQEYLRSQQTEKDQREADARAAQEDYVTNWMQGQNQMGAGLPMSPGVRAIGRASGVEGPSSADQWRYNNAAPYMGAQDFGHAFEQIAAQPPVPEPPKSRTIRRGNQQVTQEWNPAIGAFEDVAEGDAFKTTPDVVNNNNIGEGIKLTEAQSKDVHFYARGKYANADLNQNENALLALGQQQGSQVPVVGNYLKTPEYRQAERAGKEFLAMILRKESGGAITAEEWQEYGPMFLPMPGDDAQTVADKRVARQRALDALKLGGGTASPVFDQIDQKFNSDTSDPTPDKKAALKKKYNLE